MKTFEVLYQSGGAATGRTVNVDVYKPDKTKDATQSGTATEVGTTGRYVKTFDADGPGWFVEVSDDAGGKACRHFGKSDWDSHGVGDVVLLIADAVADIGDQLDTIEGKVDGMLAPPMIG